jgi:hypothetical protein
MRSRSGERRPTVLTSETALGGGEEAVDFAGDGFDFAVMDFGNKVGGGVRLGAGQGMAAMGFDGGEA